MSDYRALYRKWRPTTFDDVSGQDAVTDILKYEVANNKLSHAYLFSGSRGTGKTSCAKILAKAVNCENSKDGNPCNRCQACRSIDLGIATDVIEMDAASNNGVDNVRDMKDEIAFTPAILKYRVYIIDEVHMMSQQAFNALLKTLEEPPTYVIFILATTEYHKIPTTIISRCQRFDFKRISGENIVNRLFKIAKEENIDITEDGARVIARVSRGGMRDAISLLELCAGSGKKIDDLLVFETVGSGNRSGTYKLISAIQSKDYDTVYSTVNDVVMTSADISVFWQELIDSYRDIMVVKNTDKAKEYLDLTDAEYDALRSIALNFTPARLAYHISILEAAVEDMQRAINAKRSIAEIALTRMCDAKSTLTSEALLERIEELERELSLMKLGVGTSSRVNDNENSLKVLETKKIVKADAKTKSFEAKLTDTDEKSNLTKRTLTPYSNWKSVIEKMTELKKHLAVKFLNSRAYKLDDGAFLIKMNSFFVTDFSRGSDELKILVGVIAQAEGIAREDVRIQIEPEEAEKSSDKANELEQAINNL